MIKKGGDYFELYFIVCREREKAAAGGGSRPLPVRWSDDDVVLSEKQLT